MNFRNSLCIALVAASCGAALAAPGAHGPGGEHLDAPTAGPGGSALPRFEAATDQFELVAQLGSGELSIVIDRFATGEPLLRARVLVESGALKAEAKFHEDHGDYAVDDAALLKQLAQPGEHPVVITVLAGDDSDLLNGTLVVRPAAAGEHGHGDHDHAHERSAWLGAAAAGSLLLAGVLWWRRRRAPGLAQGARS